LFVVFSVNYKTNKISPNFLSVQGAGIINGWHLPGIAVVLGKSSDLFTSKSWATMGLQRPAA